MKKQFNAKKFLKNLFELSGKEAGAKVKVLNFKNKEEDSKEKEKVAI